MSRPVRVVLVILGVLVLLAAAAGLFVWIKIAGLKDRLVTELGKSLDAQVQISSVAFDPWKGEMRVAGISLISQKPSAPWDKAQLSQAVLHFHLADAFSSHIPVTIEASGWNIVFHSRTGTAEASYTAALPESIPAEPPSRKVDVTKIVALDGSAEIDFSPDRKVFFHDVRFNAESNGAGVWTTDVHLGSLVAGTLKSGECAVEIRAETEKISFTGLRMQVDPGVITGEGEVTLSGQHDAKVSIKAADVPVTMLVSVDWQMKLSGQLNGTLQYKGNDQGGDAKGSITVTHGKFNVLPWLGKLTAMAGLQDITDVEVDTETADYTWKDHALHLSNIDIRKTDVTRISGTVDVAPNGQVDGKLKLGLPSSITAKWPQVQTQVFSTQQDDYNWADVHLTGTSDNLHEDLTPRLLAAGMSSGGDLYNQATQKASDLYHSIFGK